LQYNISYILPTISLVISATAFLVLVGIFPLISQLGYILSAEGQSDNSIIRRMTNISAKDTMETFDLVGSIAGLIYTDAQYNARVMAPEILSGKWDLKVIIGRANHFAANFDQIAISGSPSHKVEITNLTEEAGKGIQLTSDNTRNIAIRGTADIIFDQKLMKNIPIEIFFNKLKVMEMHLTMDKFDPFRGKPITGLIDR
jgi:hypothetical protein